MAAGCLVVGGSGFLGRHLVRELKERGAQDVTVFDIRKGNSVGGVQHV